MRRTRKQKKLQVVLMIVIGVAVFVAFACNSLLEVEPFTIQSKKVSKPIRLALITDLHSCDYGEGQKALIDAIIKENPDVVLLGGDIVDDKLPRKNAKDFLLEVSKRFPCFYVTGNHEYWSGDFNGIQNMISSYGITILNGDCKRIQLNGQQIAICGIDDPCVGNDIFNKELKDVASKRNNSEYTILLTHRPEYINEYLIQGFDLILAGHAHGGQWRIPGLINGLYAPNQGWFPKYAGGLYEFGSTKFIVSRGLARESTKVPRVFNRPEIVIVDVEPMK